MTKMVPIVITILRLEGKFLLLKRKNPPYENLWGLVGGKVNVGEHIPSAAVREVMEETGSSMPTDYALKGVVSERLVTTDGNLKAHFLIFVGDAGIDTFHENHREGQLALFDVEEVQDMHDHVVPSDYEMFHRFRDKISSDIEYHEAELIQDGNHYILGYYHEG